MAAVLGLYQRKLPRAKLYYINRLEKLITKHKILERVGQAHENSTSKASLKIKLDKIGEGPKRLYTSC